MARLIYTVMVIVLVAGELITANRQLSLRELEDDIKEARNLEGQLEEVREIENELAKEDVKIVRDLDSKVGARAVRQFLRITPFPWVAEKRYTPAKPAETHIDEVDGWVRRPMTPPRVLRLTPAPPMPAEEAERPLRLTPVPPEIHLRRTTPRRMRLTPEPPIFHDPGFVHQGIRTTPFFRPIRQTPPYIPYQPFAKHHKRSQNWFRKLFSGNV